MASVASVISTPDFIFYQIHDNFYELSKAVVYLLDQ